MPDLDGTSGAFLLGRFQRLQIIGTGDGVRDQDMACRIQYAHAIAAAGHPQTPPCPPKVKTAAGGNALS